MVISSLFRAGAEQGLAVVAAEQEDEPVQVLAQLAGVVGGVADELFQQGAEAPPVAGQPPAQELQQLGELGRVHGIEPDIGHAVHRLPRRGCAAYALYRWISLIVVRGTTPASLPVDGEPEGVVLGGDGDDLARVDQADLDLLGGHHDAAAGRDPPLHGHRPGPRGRAARGLAGAAQPEPVPGRSRSPAGTGQGMNDLFGAESFTQSQIQEFVNGLVQRLLSYPDLVRLTRVNTKKQFMDLYEFQTMVTEAVVDNQDAHNTMADYFFSDGSGINAVIVALADAFYEAAVEQRTDA